MKTKVARKKLKPTAASAGVRSASGFSRCAVIKLIFWTSSRSISSTPPRPPSWGEELRLPPVQQGLPENPGQHRSLFLWTILIIMVVAIVMAFWLQKRLGQDEQVYPGGVLHTKSSRPCPSAWFSPRC
jgi:hypothetical protein